MTPAAARPLAEGVMTLDADGRPHLLQSRCLDCGALAFPARQRCAACSSTSLAVEEAPSRGEIYSWTTSPGPSPRVVAMVRLENGLMVQGLSLAEPGEVAIGMAVRLAAAPAGRDAEGHALLTYAFELEPPEVS